MPFFAPFSKILCLPGKTSKTGFYFSLFPFLLLLTCFTTPLSDEGFNWQSLESGMLKVHWYAGDDQFGKAALETAQAGLQSIARLLPPDLQQPVEIYIYATAIDFEGALAAVNESWVAGHADPEAGIIRVLIEPGPAQQMAMEQRIPHELMHVMLYRHTGAGYEHLPAWLREGTAAFVETSPNVDYDRSLADAAASRRLIPLRELCLSFPAQAGQAFLAYAEARSFTVFLYNTYGAEGVMSLALSYADGLDCEQGPERALGVSLSGLESQWHSSALGEYDPLSSLQNGAPYLVLLCLVLVFPMAGILHSLRKRNS